MKRPKYWGSKSFRHAFLISLSLFLIVWFVVFFLYHYFLIVDLKDEQYQKNEFVCTEATRQLDFAAESISMLQKTIITTSWISKYMSGQFQNEFGLYSQLMHCEALRQTVFNTPVVERVAMLFPNVDTAVSDVSWTTMTDFSNYAWQKYRVDITPIIRDISGPVPFSALNDPNQYYFQGGHLLLLQKLEIVQNPRGYALYIVPTDDLFSPLFPFMQGNDASGDSMLMRMTLQTYQNEKIDTVISHESINYSKDISVVSVERHSQFLGCKYIFEFDSGFSSSHKAQLFVTYAVGMLTLIGGCLLIWWINILVYGRFCNHFKMVLRGKNTYPLSIEALTTEMNILLDETANRTVCYNEAISEPFSAQMTGQQLQGELQVREEVQNIDGNENEAEEAEINPQLGKQIVSYVNEHFCDYELSLKMLSKRFSASISAVSRSFKRATGVNFLEYLTGLRMTKAKELLKQGDLSIRSIATSVGYENDYSFRRAFERSEGMRLQQFRNEQPIADEKMTK